MINNEIDLIRFLMGSSKNQKIANGSEEDMFKFIKKVVVSKFTCDPIVCLYFMYGYLGRKYEDLTIEPIRTSPAIALREWTIEDKEDVILLDRVLDPNDPIGKLRR